MSALGRVAYGYGRSVARAGGQISRASLASAGPEDIILTLVGSFFGFALVGGLVGNLITGSISTGCTVGAVLWAVVIAAIIVSGVVRAIVWVVRAVGAFRAERAAR